jgi:tryptophan-rich sensory protein
MRRPGREVLFRKIEITAVLTAHVGLVHHRRSLLRHFFFVVYRILTRENNSSLAEGTFALVLAMLLGNGLWNYLFFRARKLFMSVVVTFLAPVMDLVLLICLIKLDRAAAWALTPYLIYRVYSVWWAYGLWRLNPEVV